MPTVRPSPSIRRAAPFLRAEVRGLTVGGSGGTLTRREAGLGCATLGFRGVDRGGGGARAPPPPPGSSTALLPSLGLADSPPPLCKSNTKVPKFDGNNTNCCFDEGVVRGGCEQTQVTVAS